MEAAKKDSCNVLRHMLDKQKEQIEELKDLVEKVQRTTIKHS